MGRSPDFKFTKKMFERRLPSSLDIESLNVGDEVKLDIKPHNGPVTLIRSPSLYGYTDSSTRATLVVENIDYCEDMKRFGDVRCIVLRDVLIPKEVHIYSWCITTDGFIRETEHFDIMYDIENVVVF